MTITQKDFFEELKIDNNDRYSPYKILENKTNKFYVEKQILSLFVPEKKYKKILDVGCGTAFYYPLISKQSEEIHGVDFSENMLKHAKEFCEANKIDNAKFYLSEAEKLPFKDNEFDLVFCFDFLHHAKNIDKVIKEMFRVAKKGSIVGAIETNPLNPIMLIFNLFYSSVEHGIVKIFPFVIKKKFEYNTKKEVIINYNRYLFPLFSITPNLGNNRLKLLNAIEMLINKLPLLKLFSAYYIIYSRKNEI